MTLQRLEQQHIPHLVTLSARLGWDYAPEELALILNAGIAYGHVLENGAVVASAAVFPYGDRLASVGMVMVDPDHRRQGLGRSATERALEAMPASTSPVMLVATADGIPLYEKMGFHTVGTLHKYLANQYLPRTSAPLPAGYEILPLTPDDHADVLHLDSAAVGAERQEFLRLRVEQAVEGFVIKSHHHGAQEIVGYGLAIQGPIYRIIGPLVAPTAELALALFDHMASHHQGPLRVDVPSEQAALVQALPERGFELANVPPVMLRHAEDLPPRAGTYFALAAQAYG